MSFEEVLDQAIDMLRRRGRLTYRALKRQFDLDDHYFEDLKEELIKGQQLAVDENGEVLVWAGAETSLREPTTFTHPNDEPAAPRVVLPTPIDPILANLRTPEAERRQLTVMFCDLVGSTSLSGALDPEDLRDVVRSYQATCTDVITRFDGHVAQLLGDGLLVYFGYPQAHEDDAQRAVRSGLGIIEAIGALNLFLEQDERIRLAVRVGIHTGLVVVGEMGGAGRQEQLALGETPNIAARIQGIAEPDTVVISADTHRLIQGYFDCDSLDEHDLRGVSQPIAVYQVLQDRGVQSRLDIASTRGLTPLVGRESEVTLLFERWTQAKDGQGQVLLLSGEAGIGKSRLVQALKDHVADEAHTRLECRSSPYFTNSALYPIIDMLHRTLQFQTDDTLEQKVAKLEQNLSQYPFLLEETVPLFATLLSVPIPENRYPPLSWTPQHQRQKTLESIVAILLEQAERQPLLFVLEDGHWSDHTTLELLALLIDQSPTASILILITHRPEFQPKWGNRSYLTPVTLNRLSRSQIETIAVQVAGGKMLPDEVLGQLVDRTDGVPLYVEELSKSVLESGLLKEVDGNYELAGSISSLSIPATLQDSLMARLDRLMTAKVIAQLGATIGRQFSYALLQEVSGLDEVTLQRELSRLVEAELVYQRGLPPQAVYIFKHALIQDTAYASLLRSTRQGYHRCIAEVLEEQLSEIVEAQPEILAHHYTEAGLNKQAVEYWQKAGEQAEQRSAHVEAISHLHKGLELLSPLPETPEHLQKELDLQVALGTSLMVTEGWSSPDAGHVYRRAHTLCQLIEDDAQWVRILDGQRRFYAVRGELQSAREFAEELLAVAQKTQNREYLLKAHYGLGYIRYYQGAFVPAYEHWEQCLALYGTHQHRSLALSYGVDPGVHCLIYSAIALGYLGYVDQSVARRDEALTLAQELSHPFSLTVALALGAFAHEIRREWQQVQAYAESAIVLGDEYGFTQYTAAATIARGLALAMQGDPEAGMAEIHQGVALMQSTGSRLLRPHYLALFAEVCGKVEEALGYLSEALAIAEKTGARWCEAELCRLKGEFLLKQSPDNATDAESCFHQAILIAQNQSAKSWELRAATSLARLWQSQGRREEARELLTPVYDWFTEGFDTADLKDAKALVDELG